METRGQVSSTSIVWMFYALLMTLLCMSSCCNAWTYVMMEDEALAETADLVVIGTIVDRSFESPNPSVTMAATHFKLSVESIVKGNEQFSRQEAEELTVSVPGGPDPKDSSRWLTIPGAPVFQNGEKVMLFLTKHKDLYFIHHFGLGAFHQFTDEQSNEFALRGVDDSAEMARNLTAFANYVQMVASVDPHKRSISPISKDYMAKPVGELSSAASYLTTSNKRYNLFTYQGYPVRWFEFDVGGIVRFARHGMIPGVPGGGILETGVSMNAWNEDSSTPIRYMLEGETTSLAGHRWSDGINSVIYEDPADEIPGAFDCRSGGAIAYGGYWSTGTLRIHKGRYWAAVREADVVVQNGVSCWLGSTPSARNSLESVLTHEFGHTLGIDHSCGDSRTGNCDGRPSQNQAIMRAVAQTRGSALNSDDVDAIKYIYA